MEPEQRRGAETVVQGDAAAQDSRALSLPEDAKQHPEAPAVAGYLLVSRLGLGTYGEVWRAWQSRTHKWVALKVYSKRAGLDWALLQREVERLAQLDKHPYIVSLLDADLAANPPYCALELIGGGALEGRKAPDTETASGWLEKVAEALAFVHSRGVIHCDLKPANILLDEEGRPRVADFGQARAAGGEAALGSFFFMAPEQAAPSSERAKLAPDVRWDVYALGATAYALLTGKPPHAALVAAALEKAPGRDLDSSLTAYREAVRAAGAPALPPSVDADLAAIVRKCLEPVPEKRYGSAGMVLFDLRNRRTGMPVTPLAGDPRYRARKFVRRNALLVAVAAAAALGLVAAGAQIVRERDRLKGQLAASLLAQARLQADLGDAVGAVSFSAESNRLRPSHLARANTLAYLSEVSVPLRIVSGSVTAAAGLRLAAAYNREASVWDAATGKLVGPPARHAQEVTAIALSPDGRRMATGAEDGAVRLWDAASGRLTADIAKAHARPVVALAFSPDGRRLASGSEDATAQVWDAATGAAEGPRLRHDDHVHTLAFFPDGKTLLTASEEDHTVRLWSVPDGRQVLPTIDLKNKVYRAVVSPDGRYFATASLDKTARIFRAATGKDAVPPMIHEGRVLSVAFSPDGRRLLTASLDEAARLWDTRTGRLIGAPMRHDGAVRDANFSPDGRLIVSASSNGSARVWDAATQQPVGGAFEHASVVRAAAFLSPELLYTRSTGGLARVWTVARPAPRGVDLTHDGPVFTAEFSGDGRALVTSSKDKTARVWSAAGKLLATIVHPKPLRCASISQDGRLVVTGAHDGARLFTAEGRLVARLIEDQRVDLTAFSRGGGRVLAAGRKGDFVTAGLDGAVLARWHAADRPLFAAFSPDGRLVAAGGRGGVARLWDAATGKLLAEMPHDSEVQAGVFSADGTKLVTSSDDRTVRLWRVPSGERAFDAVMRHKDAVRAVAISPDGRLIASGGDDQRLRLWDAATGEPRGRKILHRAAVRAVAFSPDGSTILTGSEDKTARLWDAATGIEIGKPMKHSIRVIAVAFSPDGRQAVTAGPETAAHLWSLDWLDQTADPAELSRRAQVATLKRVNADGDLTTFPPEEWRRLARLDGSK